jgi:hypothetical protein
MATERALQAPEVLGLGLGLGGWREATHHCRLGIMIS